MSKYAEDATPGYLLNLEDHARMLRACGQMRRAMRTLDLDTQELRENLDNRETHIIREKNSEICRTVESCTDRVKLMGVLQDIKKYI